MQDDLTQKKCVPCEEGVPVLSEEQIQQYKSDLKSEWQVIGVNKKLVRKYSFKDFKEAMDFVNKVAELAESEGHHPDISISYNKVTIDLSTHAIGGLSENDFILARKIELL